MTESAHPLVLRAREALARSELKTAELAVEERLKMAGRDINALEVRYLIQKHRGQLGEAARTLDTVIGINSRADWARNALLQLLLAHGKLNDAEQVARTALQANPNNAEAHNVLGSILSDRGDLPAGETHFRRALEVGTAPATAVRNLADNLRKQGRLDEAEGYFSRAHQLAPDDVRTLVSWATLCEARGNSARARELIDRAAAISPEEVSVSRAHHLACAGHHEEALAVLNAAKSLGGLGQLARGRLHDRLGRYDEAWQDFVAGKRKLASEAGGLQYKAEAVENLFDRFKRFFTRENMARMPRAKLRTDVPQPIFIMGPPRSGASLVERILCNHTGVTGGGEITFLAELPKVATQILLAQQPFPDSLAQSWTADRRFVASVLRDYYLAHAENRGLLDGDHGYFTDNMPFNEIYLPLLALAFPQAKIIHVVRHPLDVCISMMSNNVTHGFHCGYRIEDTVHHLAAVFELSEHYRRELDCSPYVLQYESLHADPAAQIRKLLDHLGLPAEEACMRIPEHQPHEDEQVLNRYRHYMQYLRPCVSRLRSMLERYNYSWAPE
jgi:tetratricopeptide (TPR) repeat protein